MENFNGFDEPTQNWSRLPHALIDNLYRVTSESELKVILYIIRHTWGYHDDQKKITIEEFSNGRKRKDGSRIDNGLGISENAIRAGIEKATEHGFIIVIEDATDKARIKRYYQIKSSTPEVQKLNPRGSEVEPHDSTSEPRSEKETHRKKLENKLGPLATKLLLICLIKFEGMTRKQKQQLAEVMDILTKRGITEQQLTEYDKFWRQSWRKGSPPTLLQVPELWGEFEQWQSTHTNGNGKITLTAIDQSYKDDLYYKQHGKIKVT